MFIEHNLPDRKIRSNRSGQGNDHGYQGRSGSPHILSLTQLRRQRHTLKLNNRIMIIDDDASLLGFTSKYLTRLGYEVATFRHSEAAWAEFCAPSANYTLALVDVSLGGVSGTELSRMMLNANPNIRLIITSGYPFDTNKLPEADPDRVAFLQKPFTPAMLTETVERLTRAVSSDNAD